MAPTENSEVTHPDTPTARFRRDSDRGALELSDSPPELLPLPLNPTAHDVAVRYGSDSAFLRQQWPALVRKIESVAERVETVASWHVSRWRWVWPMLTGVFAALYASQWLRR